MTLNKFSFYLFFSVAALYIVSMILSLVKIRSIVVNILQAVAAALMVIVVAILAGRYVKNRTMVWKLLYVICLLLVVVGIIIPLVF